MLYIGTKNNGLWQWNPLHNRLTQVKGVGNIVTTLNLQDRHNLCVSCDGSGAYRVNVTSGEIIETFSTVGDNGHRLPSDAVYCYYRDTNGVNWFGFYRHGLLYTYHKTPLFRTFRFGQFSSGGMDVRSFYIHEHQYVLGTNHGLWFVDTRRNITHCFKPRDMNGAHIITRIVWYDGKYFIATYDGGLHVLDPQTMHIGKLGKDALLDQTSVTALAVSSLGRLWIGSSEGIYILDTQGRLTRYTENNARIYGGQISGIVFDRRGQAWLTGPKGISIYSSSTKTFSNACFPKGFFNNEGMLSGIFNHSGKLLFYSSKRVYYTDSAMHDFGEFRLPEGIFEEMLYSVLDDRRGHYWVASEIGLFRMDYDKTSLQYFGYGEGLVSQLVNVLSLDENGRIWIATSKGLLYVDQYDVRRWEQSTHYKVLLYDIQCAGTQCSAMTESLVNTEGKHKLHWNVFSDRLTFKIVLADFARSEGRLFEYRIDGSTKWRTVRDNQNVEVSSLFLGRHHIQIRQAGAPGTTRTYTLVVIPSWLAITELLMLVIVAALFLFWNHYRKNTNALLKERDEMEKALIEVDQQQQSEELSEDVGPSDNQKYERVHINEAECANIVQQMRKYIESNKPYLRPDYKMSDLAGQLHLSPSKLSQVFNLYLKENYYEFINRYRLEEFKKLVAGGESSKYTLTALSEKCGFKKSNFFSTFRKVEGMTPTEYMKKKGY
jgi:AraC-like DNA-binding protein/sugar lactone lactonase YvrE